MGRDIFAEQAVLVSVDDMAPFFTSYKLATAFAGYLRDHPELWPDGEIILEAVWDDGRKIYVGAERDMVDAIRFKGGNGLFSLMRYWTYGSQRGEVGHKTWTDRFGDADSVVNLWNLYLTAWKHFAKQDIPLVSSLKTFGRRIDGAWDLEKLRHPYLAFSGEETFEYSLTGKGRALLKVIGRKVEVTT